MANIAFVKIEKSEEYRDLAEVAGIQFESGVPYLLQIQGAATICLSAEKPTKGGFVLYNSPVFQYTPNGTETLWVMTHKPVAYVNIATQL